MTMTSPLAAASPVCKAPPLPRLRSCSSTRHWNRAVPLTTRSLPSASSSRAASAPPSPSTCSRSHSRVPSRDPSSTMTISFATPGKAATTLTRHGPMVKRSLYAGMSTVSFIEGPPGLWRRVGALDGAKRGKLVHGHSQRQCRKGSGRKEEPRRSGVKGRRMMMLERLYRANRQQKRYSVTRNVAECERLCIL